MKINGIECYLDHMKDSVDHSIYFHKVMCVTKEYKDKPRDGYSTSYYILESKLPMVNYSEQGSGSMTNDDWYIIFKANDFFEVKRVLLWLQRSDHEPLIEFKDAKEFID